MMKSHPLYSLYLLILPWFMSGVPFYYQDHFSRDIRALKAAVWLGEVERRQIEVDGRYENCRDEG